MTPIIILLYKILCSIDLKFGVFCKEVGFAVVSSFIYSAIIPHSFGSKWKFQELMSCTWALVTNSWCSCRLILCHVFKDGEEGIAQHPGKGAKDLDMKVGRHM